MTILAHRPVISCGRVLIPLTDRIASLPLHRRLNFEGVGYHPGEPWVAICRIVLGESDDPVVAAVALSPERLRIIAGAMIAIADELDIKPVKGLAR